MEGGRRKEARSVVCRHTQSSSAIGNAHKRARSELASRLKLSTHETVRLLTDLEEGGAVKLNRTTALSTCA
jgi:hypothetical protein